MKLENDSVYYRDNLICGFYIRYEKRTGNSISSLVVFSNQFKNDYYRVSGSITLARLAIGDTLL